MRYLQCTKDFMLTYKTTYSLETIGYSDFDYVKRIDTKKSTSCYIFMLVGGPISQKSAKQSFTASSIMEAEFVAGYEASSHDLSLRNFIMGLEVVDTISRPPKIHCDNQAAVFFSKNNKSSGASKHFDMKYLVTRERVQNQIVSIQHI